MPRDAKRSTAAGAAPSRGGVRRANVVALGTPWHGGPLDLDEPASESWLEEWPGGEDARGVVLPVYGRDVRGFRHVFCGGRTRRLQDDPAAGWGVFILMCDACEMIAVVPHPDSGLGGSTLYFRYQDLDLGMMYQGGPDAYRAARP